MLKKSLNGLLIFFLVLSYINRGLFVDASEAGSACSSHISHTENEINSVLELFLDMIGITNDIDEDGDLPESYCSSKFIEPFVHQNSQQNNLFSKEIKRTFYIFSDLLFSQPVYGQIDHPPEC